MTESTLTTLSDSQIIRQALLVRKKLGLEQIYATKVLKRQIYDSLPIIPENVCPIEHMASR
jgi:hypothetical protein